jgi:hypothetical protein
MRMIRGLTNQDVMRNIDVYLDGKYLDHEHYGVVTADDKTGEVEYIMFERGTDGQRRVVTETVGCSMTLSPPITEKEVEAHIERWKLFKVHGQVEFDPRPWIPSRDFFVS